MNPILTYRIYVVVIVRGVLMGRKPEFKATKSFTMGLQELGWLKEYSERKNEKASAIVNKLIRKAMLADNTEEKKKIARGPVVFCTNCMKRKEFEQVENNWLCFDCGEDKTEVIEYHIKKAQILKQLD